MSTKINIERLVAAYQGGLSICQVAEEFAICPTTVRKYLAKSGIVRRTISEAMRLRPSRPLSEEHKQKLRQASQKNRAQRSASSRALWRDPEFRAKMKGRLHTAETKGAISIAIREKWQDKVYRAVVVEATKAALADAAIRLKTKWLDQAYRQAMAEQSQRLWSDPIYRLKQREWVDEHKDEIGAASKALWSQKREQIVAAIQASRSPELAAKLSELSRLRWLDPIYRAKCLAALREALGRPEVRQKLCEHAVRLWADPDFRIKHKRAVQEAFGPSVAAKHRLAVTALWLDPKYRAIQGPAHRAAMANPATRAKLSVSSRRRWQDPEFRERMAVVRAEQIGHRSSVQDALYGYLRDLGIRFHEEGPITRIGFYVFDCLVPRQERMRRSLLIECQGDYWHSLARAQIRDKAKFTYIARYFPEYEIMYVWEHEFYTKDRVLDRLRLKLGLDCETIDFDFADIRIAVDVDVSEFLQQYHYLGSHRGGKTFGAFLRERMVGCATVSPPLRHNAVGRFGGPFVELSRFCIHPNYHKRNFASWFLRRILRACDTQVVAYADCTVGHQGTIYKAAGFKLHHVVEPDYWYIDAQGYVMHKQTLFGRAKRLCLHEAEYAARFGYVKKFGGPKMCFVLPKS